MNCFRLKKCPDGGTERHTLTQNPETLNFGFCPIRQFSKVFLRDLQVMPYVCINTKNTERCKQQDIINTNKQKEKNTKDGALQPGKENEKETSYSHNNIVCIPVPVMQKERTHRYADVCGVSAPA